MAVPVDPVDNVMAMSRVSYTTKVTRVQALPGEQIRRDSDADPAAVVGFIGLNSGAMRNGVSVGFNLAGSAYVVEMQIPDAVRFQMAMALLNGLGRPEFK